MDERLEITVRGVVQGVGFRYFIVRLVRPIGLTGWVANEAHDVVRCVAEGRRDDLEKFLAHVEPGPAGAIIKSVQAVWMPATGEFRDFSIRSGGHSGD